MLDIKAIREDPNRSERAWRAGTSPTPSTGSSPPTSDAAR